MLNCIILLCACKTIEERPAASSDGGALENNTEDKTDIDGQSEKGYDLPVSNTEEEKAETDCIETMELISDIYRDADKGNTSNVILSESTIEQMAEKVKEMGYPVRTSETYSNMENYEQLEEFLHSSKAGNSGSVLVYYIRLDGGICREKYTYDGKDMYVLTANTSWDENNTPIVTFINYTRIKEWKYTEKGWLCYELCVPEYPEVTEVVDGSCLIRVKPITEENREMSEKCVLGLGYQGNNLLCSNWDTDCMEDLDYNGMYEYLYGMKYKQKINPEDYINGIPKDEFENLIMDYLPVTSEMIFKSAAFDEENKTYKWMRLGCFNYAQIGRASCRERV